MKKILSLLILAGLSAGEVRAENELAALPVITYRGRLVNVTSGEYPAGVEKHNQMMTFRVYDTDMQGATAIWSSGRKFIPVNPDGSFEAQFGDATLAELIVTGTVTHVGLQLGEAAEITPRRALRSIAAATRALVAEGVTDDVKIGTLSAATVGAKSMSVSLAEISESLKVDAGDIRIEPFALLEGESTRLRRGKGMKVFSDDPPRDLGIFVNVRPQQVLEKAPADGVALIHCVRMRTIGVMWIPDYYSFNDMPGIIQFCRKDDEIKTPISATAVKVTFWDFVK